MVNKEKFIKWLLSNGAEILPVSNEYEEVRFKGTEVGVLYKSGKTSNYYTKNTIQCYQKARRWSGKPISTGRKPTYKREKLMLLKRDGNRCFYCHKRLGNDITLEHLIGLTSGGLNILSNMVLAHKKCNYDVGNKPLNEKVEIAIFNRTKDRVFEMR